MIFQGDVIIKTAIELGIEDMRKNPWLIDHMLSDFTTNPYLVNKYGEAQVEACKEWFRNNQIDIYMRGRNDKDRTPCITIAMGPSNEKVDMKSMADQSTESVILLPNKIGKPIPYIVKPFTPVGYDEDSGQLEVSEDIDLSIVSPGMLLVNPANGKGYIIQDIEDGSIFLESGVEVQGSYFGIIPQFQYYKARVEHAFFDESYQIGCHAHGDAQNVLFLWAIVKYSILRYRESLLEANGFAESSISSSNPDLDDDFTGDGPERVWVRYLTLTGQTENSWIKSPRRFIEIAALRSKAKNGFIGGISIISNTDPSIIDKTQQLWYTDTEQELEEAAGTFVPPTPTPPLQSFVLLETGSFMELENGDLILLENSA